MKAGCLPVAGLPHRTGAPDDVFGAPCLADFNSHQGFEPLISTGEAPGAPLFGSGCRTGGICGGGREGVHCLDRERAFRRVHTSDLCGFDLRLATTGESGGR